MLRDGSNKLSIEIEVAQPAVFPSQTSRSG